MTKGAKSQLTLQSVNSRLEEMAAKFQESMEKFNSDLMDSANVGDRKGGLDLVKKFKEFQKSINDSLSNLKSQIKIMEEDQSMIKSQINNFEIKKNCKSLLIHGIQESNSDLYIIILDFFKTRLGISLNKNDLDVCYRFGKKGTGTNNKPRPVAATFCQRWMRDVIFFKKKSLKGSVFLITELLTSDGLRLLKASKDKFGKNAWTFGGYVYVKGSDGVRKRINSVSDLTDTSNSENSESD